MYEWSLIMCILVVIRTISNFKVSSGTAQWTHMSMKWCQNTLIRETGSIEPLKNFLQEFPSNENCKQDISLLMLMDEARDKQAAASILAVC
ncbi:hypothetical protein L596_010500 [Steinernema carpocapsae]|uniref:Uncharacterized protein n=1 Tax=Steinernema carpocapsae TaxID=34508 RepID=A0A4U5PIT9_STECR|nr:hypothetical protein L596_010500 [Steinernema carpocapsae]